MHQRGQRAGESGTPFQTKPNRQMMAWVVAKTRKVLTRTTSAAPISSCRYPNAGLDGSRRGQYEIPVQQARSGRDWSAKGKFAVSRHLRADQRCADFGRPAGCTCTPLTCERRSHCCDTRVYTLIGTCVWCVAMAHEKRSCKTTLSPFQHCGRIFCQSTF
jgi:hypothetical protein